jgi:hypothetical protein
MSPRVETVDGVGISVYFNDHNPPHFHALEAGEEALVTIRDLVVLEGSVASIRTVLAWAETNREALIAAWNSANPENLY